jgi:hypothetical protein
MRARRDLTAKVRDFAKQMNHFERFWTIVEDMLPDYRERQKQLKELQRRLGGEDWDIRTEAEK